MLAKTSSVLSQLVWPIAAFWPIATRNKTAAGAAGAPRNRDFMFEWATMYYVSGRLAARARLVPIHGNLLHHAVEMYLKAALLGHLSVNLMRTRYRHDLKRLWKQYKVKESDPTLGQFDATIRALHAFEDIRYPDKFAASGGVLSIAWTTPINTSPLKLKKEPKRYEVFISDVDRLVVEVLKKAGVQPTIVARLFQASAEEALQYQNPCASVWSAILPPKTTTP